MSTCHRVVDYARYTPNCQFPLLVICARASAYVTIGGMREVRQKNGYVGDAQTKSPGYTVELSASRNRQDLVQSNISQKLHTPARGNTIIILVILLIILIPAAWFGLHYFQQRQFLSHVPVSLRQNFSFPIYYPAKLPEGYNFQEGSDRIEGPIVFYNINSGVGRIIVSEQAAPENSPDLTFPNSSNIDTPNGQATLGTGTVGTLVFLKTKATLINMSASKNIPPGTLADIIRNMRSVH